MKYWNLEHEKFESFEDYINKARSLRESGRAWRRFEFMDRVRARFMRHERTHHHLPQRLA